MLTTLLMIASLSSVISVSKQGSSLLYCVDMYSKVRFAYVVAGHEASEKSGGLCASLRTAASRPDVW